GTLAAAKQAALLGLRGFALSAPASAEPDFGPLKPWIRRVLATVLPDSALSLVNVNFPRAPRGLVWTRVSVRQYDGRVVPMEDPQGRPLYWFTVVPIRGAGEGTDRWAIERGWVSLTPLRLDLTDEDRLAAARVAHPLDDAAAARSSSPPDPDPARAVREGGARPAPRPAGAARADARTPLRCPGRRARCRLPRVAPGAAPPGARARGRWPPDAGCSPRRCSARAWRSSTGASSASRCRCCSGSSARASRARSGSSRPTSCS